MNERVKELRKYLKMSQEDFGKLLGITKSGVSDIESGRRKVTEQHIFMLKSQKNVNEHWLRDGTGEMFVEQTRDEQIASFIGDMLKDEGESFKRRLISALANMDEVGWEALEKLVDALHEKKD